MLGVLIWKIGLWGLNELEYLPIPHRREELGTRKVFVVISLLLLLQQKKRAVLLLGVTAIVERASDFKEEDLAKPLNNLFAV